MDTRISLKIANKYECLACDYFTSNQYDYNKHLSTRKHKNNLYGNQLRRVETDPCPTGIIKSGFNCQHCYKSYMNRSGLWKHSKICKPPPVEDTLEESLENSIVLNDKQTAHTEGGHSSSQLSDEVIIEFIKQNQEFKELIIEQQNKLIELASKPSTVITQNNQSFNLNVFLNETCKDAMTMKDFIANVDINMRELENVGINGYVVGISDIILSRLNQLDISKRPLHCTDLKREVVYVRDDDAWCKDDDNTKLRNMITHIAKKNYNKIPEWMEQNPECEDMDNQKYDFCFTMMRRAIGEMGEEQVKLDDKVLKNIIKQTHLNRK